MAGTPPIKFTKEVQGKLEYAFSIGATIREACLYADISVQTFYNWQEKMPKVFEHFEDLRETPIFIARESVVKGIKRDPKLALDFLGRKAKKEFGNNVDITTDGKPLPTPILGGITQEGADAKDQGTS